MGSQIPPDRYQFYSDNFAAAAEAGLGMARALVACPVNRVNTSTFDVFLNAIEARNDLITSLQSSYEQTFISAGSLEPMRNAFTELSDHIQKFTNTGVDLYLTSTGIKVKNTYAKIHRLATGETISAANIEG